jgi:hypothetical protein
VTQRFRRCRICCVAFSGRLRSVVYTLMLGPTSRTETLVNNQKTTLLNSPEQPTLGYLLMFLVILYKQMEG